MNYVISSAFAVNLMAGVKIELLKVKLPNKTG